MRQTSFDAANDLMSWIQCDASPWHWTVHPEWSGPLLDAAGLRFAAWQEQGWLTVIKSAAHRTVWRSLLPQGSVYIKYYPLSDLRARVRQQLRPSKARTEATMALALAARGVPTITPLAIGETAGGASYLVTLALEDTRTLREFIENDLPKLSPRERTHVRRQLARALAMLLARMHDAGVQHADLHAGNVLVRWKPEAQAMDTSHPSLALRASMDVRLFLIDLHAVRLGPPLDWPASRDNLVMLNRWFVQRSSRTDRVRFWVEYTRRRVPCFRGPDSASDRTERPAGPRKHATPTRHRALELEVLTWNSCLAFWRKRDARCLGTNRYFYRLSHAGSRAWAVRDVPVDLLTRLLADPDQPFAQPVKLLKHSRSSTVAEIELVIDGRPRRLIWKRFMVTKWSDPWLHLSRPTPALRSWINGHRLLESGLPTARPLAVVHRHHFGLPRECYLLTEQLPDTVDLHAHIAGMSWERRRVLVDRLARLLRELHRRQLSHRDLKAANLLVGHDGQLFLIDLVGLERWRKLPRSRQVQNLARLHASFHLHPHVSRTDKLRLLRSYLAWGLHGKASWKDWCARLAKRPSARSPETSSAAGRWRSLPPPCEGGGNSPLS